ncbi:MAG: phospho-sugar mutase, partial [Acidimicrobiales bacterium]
MATPTNPADLRARAGRWLEIDPDPETRSAIQAMLDADDAEALASHFGARLEFGTAGLRAPRGPGSNRMNRVIVRQTAAALARHLGAGSTFIVAYDARYGSEEYATDTAQVLAAAGCQVLLLDRPVITPVLAFAVHRLEAAAGVMVTASHNPAADNGYKMYDGEGIQIVPPTDVAVQAAINEVLVEGGDPPLAPPDHPAIEQVPVDLESGVVGAYLDAALRCL